MHNNEDQFNLTADTNGASFVSLFPDIKATTGGVQMSIADLMDTQKSEHWAEKVNTLRQMVQSGADKKDIEEFKQTLPYFTGSGTFSERNISGLIKHSGKLILDFDKINEYTTIERAWEQLENDKYTEYLYHSCSGRGLAVVVAINPNKHLDTFLYLEKYYLDTYGLKIDKSCKDITRARFITYDPGMVHRPNFTFVQLPSIAITENDELYERAIAIFNKHEAQKGNTFTEGNRHHYLLTLAFWLNKCGVEEAFATSNMISDFSGNEKTPKEIASIVKYCYQNNTIDHGTFQLTKKVSEMPPEVRKDFSKIYGYAHNVNRAGRMYSDNDIRHMCEQHLISESIVKNIFKHVFEEYKDEFDLDNQPQIRKVEIFIQRRWEILRNEVTQRVECRQRGTDEPFTNINPDSILRQLEHNGFKIPLDRLKSLLRSDYIDTYNPFHTYFNNLPEWDGVDYIEEMANFVTTTDQDFWVKQFKKALVRNIACGCFGYNNRIIITLVGEQQEKGKSRFIEFLCPPALSSYYTEANLDQSKDSEIQLAENFIWNLEELAGLESWEVNKLKSIISRSSIKTRRSYAEFAEKFPRRANFWASTNKVDFLGDDQNTRWLCFEVVDINHDYNNFITGVRKIDINNVWAQAWKLYHSGFNFQLDKEDIQKREASNKRYERILMEKDLLQQHFDTCEKKAGDFLSTSNILMRLTELTDNKYKFTTLSVVKALKQLGFVSDVRYIDKKTIRGWWVSNKKTKFGPPEGDGVQQDVPF